MEVDSKINQLPKQLLKGVMRHYLGSLLHDMQVCDVDNYLQEDSVILQICRVGEYLLTYKEGASRGNVHFCCGPLEGAGGGVWAKGI